jgi:two-component sensor histidine kinase
MLEILRAAASENRTSGAFSWQRSPSLSHVLATINDDGKGIPEAFRA